MLKKVFSSLLLLVAIVTVHAQKTASITEMSKEQPPPSAPKEVRWWNLLHYNISITPDYNNKYIAGVNEMTFVALQEGNTLMIELQEPMRITKVSWKGSSLSYTKEKVAYYIVLPRTIKQGETLTLALHFEGKPTQALKAPYDSGWIWAKDEKGRPWMSIACQGAGASIWLPCKDVLYDEPDNGVLFSITVPDSLTAVANGRLERTVKNKNATTTYHWKVVSPINNYNIVPYIGKYNHWHQTYKGKKGKLDCDFWVLDYNERIGKRHLQQTDTMLQAFEHWMGPYPFYEDGYKLVEAPFPGMEHQSAVAYGNGFQNGHMGKNFISGTPWGMKWDFMLVHESGHEWFGNNITTNNYGDTWIHEAFTKYLETVYTDFVFGRAAGNEYALGTWKRIKNDQPIIGTGTSDKYYKGSAMLHTIRQLIGDTVFRSMLTGLNKTFYHQTVNWQQVLSFINQHTKRDFSKVFQQYLQTTQVPVLEYYFQPGKLQFRWTSCVEGFDMPLKVSFDNQFFRLIHPTTQWQTVSISQKGIDALVVDKNFYVQSKQKETTQ